MKKILSLLLTLVFAAALAACGNAGGQEQSELSVAESTVEVPGEKTSTE